MAPLSLLISEAHVWMMGFVPLSGLAMEMYYEKLSEPSIIYSTCFTLFSVVHLSGQRHTRATQRIHHMNKKLGDRLWFFLRFFYLVCFWVCVESMESLLSAAKDLVLIEF